MRRVLKTLLLGSWAFVFFVSPNVRAVEVKGHYVVSAKAKEVGAFVEPKFVESDEPISVKVTADRNPDKFKVAAIVHLPIRKSSESVGSHTRIRAIRASSFSEWAKKVPKERRSDAAVIEHLRNGGLVNLGEPFNLSSFGARRGDRSEFQKIVVFANDAKQAKEGMRAFLTMLHYGAYAPTKRAFVDELENFALGNNQAIRESDRFTKLYEETKTDRSAIQVDAGSIGPLVTQLRNLRIDTAGTQARVLKINKLLNEFRTSARGVAKDKLTDLRITAAVDLAEMEAKEKATEFALKVVEAQQRQANNLESDMKKMQKKIIGKSRRVSTDSYFNRTLTRAENYLPYFTEEENSVQIRPIKFVYEEK